MSIIAAILGALAVVWYILSFPIKSWRAWLKQNPKCNPVIQEWDKNKIEDAKRNDFYFELVGGRPVVDTARYGDGSLRYVSNFDGSRIYYNKGERYVNVLGHVALARKATPEQIERDRILAEKKKQQKI